MHMDQEKAHLNGHNKPRAQQPEKNFDYPKLLELGRELLVAIGEDPDREGLLDTPRRWADWWREFIEYDPGTTDTVFSSISTDQMVCVSGMRVRILGLSKFARIAQKFAHQLQVQERLGEQIADEISHLTSSENVAVVLKGEHLCMSSRGIRTPGIMTTSVMRGVFGEEYETRMEFLRLIQSSK